MEVLYSGDDTLKLIDCVEAAKSSGKDAVLINLTAAEEAAGDERRGGVLEAGCAVVRSVRTGRGDVGGD